VLAARFFELETLGEPIAELGKAREAARRGSS
jgi:hypothetical protein